MEATTAQVLPNGRTARSDLRRPYCVRTFGAARVADRFFGSLAAARGFARGAGSYSIFFEYQAGCGHYLEGSTAR